MNTTLLVYHQWRSSIIIELANAVFEVHRLDTYT